MPSKAQAYLEMSQHTASQITKSYLKWTDFLSTAGRFYKYPFPEQLMIYAQRPDATACAEWDFWNQRMRRYIRRGAKGIALVDNSQGRPVLRYVFDVADTGRMDDRGLNPNLWKYQEEHRDVVAAALENRFGVPDKYGLADQMERIAGKLAGEYWEEHKEDILHIVDGSFLEAYDDFDTGAVFRSAAAVSTASRRTGKKTETSAIIPRASTAVWRRCSKLVKSLFITFLQTEGRGTGPPPLSYAPCSVPNTSLSISVTSASAATVRPASFAFSSEV